MNNAQLILKMQERYDSRTRQEILTNLNIAIAQGKTKGLELDRYRSLPKITNRSKHTVMSWFNRPKKIPLIDLCTIASYLHYNIFAFFIINDNRETAVQDFLIANDYYNEHYPVDSADIYIRAYNMQINTDKNIVVDKLEKYFGTTKEVLKNRYKRQYRIMEICNCTESVYHAWFNRGRANVRIPLLSLCKLAIAANTDIFDFMMEE